MRVMRISELFPKTPAKRPRRRKRSAIPMFEERTYDTCSIFGEVFSHGIRGEVSAPHRVEWRLSVDISGKLHGPIVLVKIVLRDARRNGVVSDLTTLSSVFRLPSLVI